MFKWIRKIAAYFQSGSGLTMLKLPVPPGSPLMDIRAIHCGGMTDADKARAAHVIVEALRPYCAGSIETLRAKRDSMPCRTMEQITHNDDIEWLRRHAQYDNTGA